jgi:hypothetical protein
MKKLSHRTRHACWGLAAALALQASVAQAELLGPEAVLESPASTQADRDRAKVKQFLANNKLQDRLRTLGVDGLNAGARVDAMTHEEVHALAERIDAMPAGGALSDNDLIIILLVALLLVVVL